MKTIIVGLDGATFSIIDAFIDAGVMPRLGELMHQACRGELLSTALHLTNPAWTSLITGRNPGSHGIFDFVTPIRTGQGIYVRLVDSRDIRCETIWSYASRRGLKVISLNFPVMFPPQPINGCMVAGWVSSRHMRRAVHPPELYERLKRVPGFDATELGWDMDKEEKCVRDLPYGEYEDWIRFHIRREQQWFHVFEHLMLAEPAELCAVLFDGVDKLQHLCWPLVDPSLYSTRKSSWDRQIRSFCEQYFRQLDEFIGKIVEMGNNDARVFLVSDHGFGPTEIVFYANVWLQQHGYLEWLPDDTLENSEAMFNSRGNIQRFDWSKTRAYAVNPSSNGIHIAVAERPGDPGVPPGEYESFRGNLIASLLEFRDPVSKHPVLRRVMTREEAFPGPHAKLAPDLTLVLDDYGFISVARADSPLSRRQEPKGMHRPEGIMIALGAGICQQKRIPQLSIVDMCSAFLYSLGVEIPDDLEGRFPAEIFTPSQLKTVVPHWGKRTPIINQLSGSDAPFSEEDEAVILAKLRSLGYLE